MVSGLTMPAAKVNALNECRTSLSRTEVLNSGYALETLRNFKKQNKMNNHAMASVPEIPI